MSLIDFKLEDRFHLDRGEVAMSGVQALLRVLLDQLRADRRAGLHNAAMVSGYRGSPLGGVDTLFLSNQDELEANDVHFLPALNEDLAATAVWGSQLANHNFQGRYDGVLGLWYGKAPGVERSGDALRHANVSGVDPNGGVLLVAGDDPASKSSTLTSASEFAHVHNETPIFYPGSVQEVLDYGRWGYALSRYSGLWSALKIVTNVADGYATVAVGADRVQAERPPAWEWNGTPWAHTQEDNLFGLTAVAMEREVYEGRLRAVDHFVAHNRLNRATVDTADASLGLVAAGKTYHDLLSALARLGFDDQTLRARGIRVFKPAVVWPLEASSLRSFATGLDTVVVVEEKRAFVELLARDALYGMPDAPTILGKRHRDGSLWFPGHGEMDADLIARELRPFLVERFGEDLVAPLERPRALIPLVAADADDATRTAGFCSGCPHNTSTAVPEGSEAGGGIGCHGMAAFRPELNTTGTTQMGGEGIQWVGAAPFVTLQHRFQNIGDGTFHHSGSLAVRQAVAAGTNITFKILYNNAVAMTGGQAVDGQLSVPALTRSLEAEGVARTLVVTDDPDKYPDDARFAPGVDVWHRSRLDEAQRALRDTPGTTVLVYDQACAAELRRDRKRGKAVDPAIRIFINEAICEGCGDCGVKSSCLSVQPVDTEFGRKTRIHQASCNKDYTCVEGDCPAFVEVVPDPAAPRSAPSRSLVIEAEELPEPERLEGGNVLMMGIGGTGVVTVNQLLATAALLDGKRADGLDQTGLSQKGGSVISNLRITPDGDAPEASAAPARSERSNKVEAGSADAYLVFDVLTGTSPVNLDKADAERTVAVVSSSKVPTGRMVRDVASRFPEGDALRATIDSVTRAADNVYFDAGAVSEALFGSHMPTNLIVVGAAYQRGVIPLSSAAIERAVELNGVAVDTNIQAFRVGRRIALDPSWLDQFDQEPAAGTRRARRHQAAADRLIATVPQPTEELLRLLHIRVPDLIDYQDEAYAARYVATVADVRRRELDLGGPGASGDDRAGMSEAVARYLYKFMAIKDEYEVARLHRSPAFAEALADQFGPGATITYKLQPPALRRLGYSSKIGLGRSGDVAFAALARMKRLRGTSLDPFGRTRHRKLERELIGEYETMIDRALTSLADDPGLWDAAVELAELPDVVRGYEDIKEANIAEFRSRAQALLARF